MKLASAPAAGIMEASLASEGERTGAARMPHNDSADTLRLDAPLSRGEAVIPTIFEEP